jgi:hypothetical protein
MNIQCTISIIIYFNSVEYINSLGHREVYKIRSKRKKP